MQDPILDQLAKEAIAEARQAAPKAVTVPPMTIADKAAGRAIFASSGFFESAPDQQRQKLRSVPALASTTDGDLDGIVALMRPNQDAIRKQWALESPSLGPVPPGFIGPSKAALKAAPKLVGKTQAPVLPTPTAGMEIAPASYQIELPSDQNAQKPGAAIIRGSLGRVSRPGVPIDPLHLPPTRDEVRRQVKAIDAKPPVVPPVTDLDEAALRAPSPMPFSDDPLRISRLRQNPQWSPLEAAANLIYGTQRLVESSPIPAGSDPMTPNPKVEADGKKMAAGAHQAFGGALALTEPLFAASAAAKPAKTLLTLGLAMLAQDVTQSTLKDLGVPPEYADLAGDFTAALAGSAAHRLGMRSVLAEAFPRWSSLAGEGVVSEAAIAAELGILRQSMKGKLSDAEADKASVKLEKLLRRALDYSGTSPLEREAAQSLFEARGGEVPAPRQPGITRPTGAPQRNVIPIEGDNPAAAAPPTPTQRPPMAADHIGGVAVGFETSQGSTYQVNGNSTTRTKSPHKGHDATDVGLKDPSHQTVYVSSGFAREVGMWNGLSSSGKRIILADGKVVLVSNGPSGARGRDRILGDSAYTTNPAVGMSPLELFQPDQDGSYRGNHPGNEIVKITTAPAPPAPTQRPPIATAETPVVAPVPATAEQPINEYRPIPNYVAQPPIPQELLGGFIKPPVFTPRPPAMSQQDPGLQAPGPIGREPDADAASQAPTPFKFPLLAPFSQTFKNPVVSFGSIRDLYPESTFSQSDYVASAKPILDDDNWETGWLSIPAINGGVLIDPQSGKALSFIGDGTPEATGRARSDAQTWAIENRIKQPHKAATAGIQAPGRIGGMAPVGSKQFPFEFSIAKAGTLPAEDGLYEFYRDASGTWFSRTFADNGTPWENYDSGWEPVSEKAAAGLNEDLQRGDLEPSPQYDQEAYARDRAIREKRATQLAKEFVRGHPNASGREVSLFVGRKLDQEFGPQKQLIDYLLPVAAADPGVATPTPVVTPQGATPRPPSISQVPAASQVLAAREAATLSFAELEALSDDDWQKLPDTEKARSQILTAQKRNILRKLDGWDAAPVDPPRPIGGEDGGMAEAGGAPVQPPEQEVASEYAGVPLSVLSAFPGMISPGLDLIPLSNFSQTEQAALRSAGLVEIGTSKSGEYEGVDSEKLWPLRSAASDAGAGKTSTHMPAPPTQFLPPRPVGGEQPPVKSRVRHPQWKPGDLPPLKGHVVEVDPKLLVPDPIRFQYKGNAIGKGGVDGRFRDVTEYDHELGGNIVVWQDPKTGILHPTDGHHRTEIAQRTKASYVNVIFSDVTTAAEARVHAALLNIGNDKGEPIDAAKIFRDGNIPIEQINKLVAPSSKLGKQGRGIAQLSPKLYRMVIDQDMTPERGALIGEKLAGNDVLQDQAFDYIAKREAKGRRYAEREIGSMVDRFKASNEELGVGDADEAQGGLFGEVINKNLIDELVAVEDSLRTMLRKDKSLLSLLGKEENAERAEAQGNTINLEGNRAGAEDAKTVLGLFEKLVGKSGPIEDILQVAAKEVAAGKSAKNAATGVYREIKAAVERLINGKPADLDPARQGGESPGVEAGELGAAAAKSIQSASDQPAASKKVAAKPKSEVAPAEKPPAASPPEEILGAADDAALVNQFAKFWEAQKANPKDEPAYSRAGGGGNPLIELGLKSLPPDAHEAWLSFVEFVKAKTEQSLATGAGDKLSTVGRERITSRFPDLAEKYFGAVDEKAPAKEVIKAAENQPAAVDAVSSGGIGTEVEPASGAVGSDNGRVAEHDGLRPDNNGNVGRDGSAGDRPNGKNAAPVDFENKRIVSAGERMIPPSDTSVIPPEIAKYLKPQQLTGAADAISAMNGPETGFLLASGTGSGKSLVSLAVAKHFADKGFSVLIVSKAEAFKFDYDTRQPTGTYARWSKTFGIPLEGYVGPERDNFVTKLEPGKVYAATYDTVFGLAPRENPKKPGVFSTGSPGIAHLVGPNTVLIMDEAHAAKNSGGGAENRANASVNMANKAGKVLMMTATPGDKPAHVQYLQRVGLLEGKSQDQQLSELGFKKKVTKGKDGKEVVNWNIDPQVGKRTVRARLDALFSRLMANGQMVKNEISMDGVDLQMTPISLPEEGYEIMDMIENRLSDGAGLKNVDGLQKAVILGHMRRAQEGYKIPHIVNMAKEELAEGRKVIIVIELVNDSPVIKRTKVMTPHGIETQEEVIHVNKSTAQALKQALFDIGLTPADIAEIHGGAKESSIEAVERFQNGSARVAIITGPSGGTGIDLDDQKGNAPRTMIIATPPFEGTANTQLIGREWRLGTKSLPRVRYVFANTATDHWNMGILADKMKTLGVIVKGEAKGAMDFANIQGGEIRPGFVPEGEFIEDDDAADAPAGAAPKALKGKGGKELPPPVEGGWLQLQPANTYENRLKLGKKGLGGEFDRNFTNRWQIPDTQANRDALAQIKGIRIDGPSNYQPEEKPKVAETPEVRAINEKIRADRAAEMDRLAAESRERVGFAPPAPKPEFGLKPQAGPDLADAGLISPPKVTPKAASQAPRDPAIAALLSGRSGQLPNLGEAPKPPAKLAFGGAKNTQERQLATPRPPMFSDPEDEPLRAREQNSDTLGGLIPEGRAKFMHKNVAEVQRGKPESAMIKAQFANGGGVLNPVVEHVGDLTHRMSEEVTSETGGYGYVKDKVEKTLRWLTKPYGFRREFVENIESNARYAGEDPADRLAKVTAALEKYADEHRKIPVFNDVQRWARDAAVLVGEKRFAKAVEELQKLKAETDKGPEAWAAKAKEVDRTAVEEFLKRRGGGVDPEDTPAYARDPDIKWEPGKPLAELKADTPASRRSRGEVATYLNKQVRKSLGGLSASAGEKAKIARLMNLGRIEIADQIAQKNNGAGFYSKDTPLADADMIRAFPELAEPRKLAFQKALSAVLANNQDPDAEAYVGAQVYDQFRKTGVIPATRPNGTPWPGRGSLEQMQKLERMRKAMGVDGLVAFLTAPQRLSEIPKWRPSVYVSKAKADTYVPGFLVLGDKIGPYWGELMQLRGQESTPIDRWDAAGQYRRMGRLIEGGKPKDAPDNEDDRQIFMRSHGELAKEFGLDRPGTAQSLLWHYEKALYSALGSPSKAGKRSDGTARYLGERGIANERGTELPADDRSANNDRADRVGEAEGRQGKGNDGGVGEARGKTSAQVPAKRTARPPVGDPEDTPLLARAPGPVWYSQLQKAIESKAMPAKAPADQIRAILRNPNSGVKADEVKWSGLDDWLSEQKGAITKEQVLDYLKQNNVVVEEVSYDGDAIKFAAYKTPGGKDYGELLMTVPERGGPEKNFQSTHWTPKNVIAHLRYETRTGPDKQKHFLMVENQSDWGQAGSKRGFRDESSPEFREKLKQAADLDKKIEDARLELKAAQAARESIPTNYDLTQNLYSLADEMRPFLRESGNLGFDSQNEAIRAISQNADYADRWEIDPAMKVIADKYREAYKAVKESDARKDSDPAVAAERAANRKLSDLHHDKMTLSSSMSKMVPDMPFADTWHELVIRRALRHAVENGFDRFSWEEGAVHADRYSLSKVASKVAWKPVEGEEFEKLGAGYITAYDHSGNQVYNQYTKVDELPKHIGEGASEALLAAPKNTDGIHELTGEGLRAGDQWPTKFYDKKIPGYVKRLAGKFGSVLEKSEIDLLGESKVGYEGRQYTVRELEDATLSPDFDENVEMIKESMRMGNTFDQAVRGALETLGPDYQAEFAEQLGGKITKINTPKTATVWSIPITEEMRDSVMQGQPLFQKTKRPPSMGLFEAADETELAKKDKERLLGQRLTAQFNSEISMQENLSKLKKKPFVQQQHNFFEALPDDEQTSLFLKGMNTPVKIRPDGKPDTASAIRDAKIRVYAKGGNRAARVYLNPAAHQIIMKAEIEAGVSKPEDPWLGAAMKPVWMYRIIGEMRSTGKLGSKVNDAELMRKMDELADQLEDAVRDSLNQMSVSLIAADGAKQDVEAVARHEQQHADQYVVEPKSNFKPAELFGQQNLLKIETNKTYQKAGEGLMSAGYPYKSIPTEVMAHVVDGRLDKDGNVMTLGVTPKEGLNLYVDLLEAAVATKGRIAYTMVQNAARSTKQTIRQIRRSRDSRSVQRPNQGGAERGTNQQSSRAGRPDGGNSGRSQDIPRTKRPPG